MLRIPDQIVADELLVDQHLPLKRCQLFHINAVKRLLFQLLDGWQDRIQLSFHLRQLPDISPIRKGQLSQISGQPDAAGQYDISIPAIGPQPVQGIVAQQIIHGHLLHRLP